LLRRPIYKWQVYHHRAVSLVLSPESSRTASTKQICGARSVTGRTAFVVGYGRVAHQYLASQYAQVTITKSPILDSAGVTTAAVLNGSCTFHVSISHIEYRSPRYHRSAINSSSSRQAFIQLTRRCLFLYFSHSFQARSQHHFSESQVLMLSPADGSSS
jgi:hypothetical protein